MHPMPRFTSPRNLDGSVAHAFDALAQAQRGVVRRGQLLDIGITDAQIDRCLSVGRWRGLAAGIVGLHNWPLELSQAWGVAVLAGGSSCALAARTAAQAAGLLGWESDQPEVVVPRGATYPTLRGLAVRVHESRRFTMADVLPETWPARVRVERALVDG